MSTSPNGRFLSYQYVSDGGDLFNITLSEAVAAAGGFSIGDPDSDNWGDRTGRNKVRGVYGVTEDGDHRVFVPAPTQSNMISNYDAGTITVGNATYVITGYRGEHVSRNRFT